MQRYWMVLCLSLVTRLKAFKGVSQRELETPVLVQRKISEPGPRRERHSKRQMTATPSLLLLPGTDEFDDRDGGSSKESMEVLRYLLSLNTDGVMKNIASEATINPRLFGDLLRQYYPQRSGGEIKWRKLGLHILLPSWFSFFSNVSQVISFSRDNNVFGGLNATSILHSTKDR